MGRKGDQSEIIHGLLELGLALHRSGKLREAETSYQALLAKWPQHFPALHLSALIAYQTGRLEEAESFFLRALDVDSSIAAVHSNYGLALQDMKKLDEALASYDAAIARDPAYGKAYYNRASVLHELKRYEEALSAYDKAIAINPDDADAYNNRGVTSQKLNRHADALLDYEKAAAIRPDFAEAFRNHGNALQSLQRYEEALVSYGDALKIDVNHADTYYQRANALQNLKRYEDALKDYDIAISLKHDYPEAHYNRGLSLQNLDRTEDAVDSYDRAISMKPDYVEAHNNRGFALQKMKKYDEALQSYEQAIRVNENYAAAWFNLGAALQEMREFDRALASYKHAITLDPDHLDAFNNSGNIFQHMNRPDDAMKCYKRVEEINPDYANARFAQGFILLSQQKLEEGWKLYEWRKKLPEPHGAREFEKPLWDGSQDVSGKRVLVHFEQGLGDTIQFCRYLQYLHARGAEVLFAPQKSLRKLMESLEGGFALVDEYDPSLVYDYHIPLMSLPRALWPDASQIPSQPSYLRAQGDRVERWRAKLGDEGFKIGVCWQGSRSKIDVGRSFPVTQFEALSKIAGVRLISLHKGDGESQLDNLPAGMKVETLGADFDAGTDAFLDTAAVVECCDLVITSDTAVAHLAGALGAKTWIVLKQVPDWRWFIGRSDSPWYPSAHLHRQQRDGDWEGVFAVIEEKVRSLLGELRAESGGEPTTGSNEHRAVFNRIYESNLWGNGSGSGSSIENTAPYRAFLSNFMTSNKIRSVVDLGCGDWQFSRLIDWSAVQYTGIDVSDVVLRNTRAHGAANISFLELNAVDDDLPGADLLLMKDVLQHWNNGDILSFIPKLQKYERALITNGFHPKGMPRLNADISTGEWRPIDLKAPPFNLPGDYVYWYPGDEPKWVFLWRRSA